MSGVPSLVVDPSFQPASVRVALVWGSGLPGCPRTAEAAPFLREALERVRSAGEGFLPPDRKTAVRTMLRFGAYKPSGRAKPSSEYLLAAAREGIFPLVNLPVDANNTVSLQWGYPASIFDAAASGSELLLRRGKAGESYVFNSAGQSIDLEDLVCVCRRDGEAWMPCGNPVKDAMATKVTQATRGVLAVIYAPADGPPADREAAAKRFAELLKTECGAAESGWLLP